MSTPDENARQVLGLDHTGIVVEDLDATVSFYVEAFDGVVVAEESETEVDDQAIGLPGEKVRLRGALVRFGQNVLEFHEYIQPRGTSKRRICDLGMNHIAFAVSDIHAAYSSLIAQGLRFHTPPRRIDVGALAGRWWVYGVDPWGNVVELCQHPPTNKPSRLDLR